MSFEELVYEFPAVSDKLNNLLVVCKSYISYFKDRATMENTYYTAIFVDVKNEKDINILKNEFQCRVSGGSVEKWNGKLYNVHTPRTAFANIILIIGLILSLNCIKFTKSWLNLYNAEIGVRRLVGFEKRKIRIWLVKKYATIITLSFTMALVLSCIIFSYINKYRNFESLRLLFGIDMHAKPVILAFLLTSIIGIISCEIFTLLKLKESLLKNIRGR